MFEFSPNLSEELLDELERHCEAQRARIEVFDGHPDQGGRLLATAFYVGASQGEAGFYGDVISDGVASWIRCLPAGTLSEPVPWDAAWGDPRASRGMKLRFAFDFPEVQHITGITFGWCDRCHDFHWHGQHLH